jgi:hypothetical protein
MNGGSKLKKYLFVIALLALVIFASGCTQSLTSSSSNYYSLGGISFNYPDGWMVVGQAIGNESIVSIRDPQSLQTNNTRGDSVLMAKAPKSANRTVDIIANQLAQTTGNTTNGTVSIAGLTANQFIAAGINQNGIQSESKIIYFEKNNMIYTIQVNTIGTTIQSQQQYFDIIINSLKVQ